MNAKVMFCFIPSQVSSICRAAVHAGVVRNQGGYVDVMPVDKRKVYVASFQNGIYSERYRAHLQRLYFTLDLCEVHSLALCLFVPGAMLEARQRGHKQWFTELV